MFGREAFFSIGLQGIHRNDVEKVEKIIGETLQKAAEEGFDPKRIESLLHQIEISQKNV
jgi:Zn-dependent M16 (insulinase) family peptidase